MEYGELCKEVEHKVKQRMETPYHFEWLSNKIKEITGERVSDSTLMRIWGYRQSVNVRMSTLDILARFVGCRDYMTFCSPKRFEESDFATGCKLEVATALQEGDRIRLTWKPDRAIEAVYLGRASFRILEAENTRLQVGDTFQCALIIEDEPLYLNNLCRRDDNSSQVYICGKVSGVKYKVISRE